MKIVFLCASVEPGRDGVGDYTRTLAIACRERGHECVLIALRDVHVAATQEMLRGELTGLRLAAARPLGERLTAVRVFLAAFEPDWISWQFVCYSYHPKGLIGKEARAWASLLAGRRTQVMFHELWIGIDRHEPWKNRLVGALQRRGILGLLKRLGPRQVHTSNATYQAVLAYHRCRADVLPLYGNIPVAEAKPDGLAPWLAGKPRDAWLVGVTFGTIHPQWEPGATAAFLRATAAKRGRTPLLLVCGRAGGHAPAILQQLNAGGALTAVETGELPSPTISQIFQAADCGIAPHPWALIGKSGAAAGMLDHGLPVLVPRDDWVARYPLELPKAEPGLLARLADLIPENAAEWLARKRTPAPALPSVADAFIASLS